jgi:hypothetical protein
MLCSLDNDDEMNIKTGLVACPRGAGLIAGLAADYPRNRFATLHRADLVHNLGNGVMLERNG